MKTKVKTKPAPQSQIAQLGKKLKKLGISVDDLASSPRELAEPNVGTNWENKWVDDACAIKAIKILIALENYSELKKILKYKWLYRDPRYQDKIVSLHLVPGTEEAVIMALKKLKEIDPVFIQKYAKYVMWGLDGYVKRVELMLQLGAYDELKEILDAIACHASEDLSKKIVIDALEKLKEVDPTWVNEFTKKLGETKKEGDKI